MDYLACDIGASSGRHILGRLADGRIELQEIYRFENGYEMKNGHLCWDIDGLRSHVLEGLKAAREYRPVSVAVDTWGVDFVLLDGEDRILGDAVAYRDGRTKDMDIQLEERMPFSLHFQQTGIAKQIFNTVYQLMSLPKEQLAQAKQFLMMPDYLHFCLTGEKSCEYTIASTSGLLNARTLEWDAEVLKAAGIPAALFSVPPVMPCTPLGAVTPQVEEYIGYPCRVVLPASHDTGSAFVAIPAKDENAVYLSSGTWSLLGVELDEPLTSAESMEAGFTNEGGMGGKIRHLKNIMGLWVLQCIRKEQGKKYTYAEMAELAKANGEFAHCIDINAPRFLAPENMQQEIRAALEEEGKPLPQTDGELIACVYHSLAQCYRESVRQLEGFTGKRFTSINIVGGGSQNRVLNQWTADALGIPVYAGPVEGTALGNIVAQMLASGELKDIASARETIAKSFEIETYLPQLKGERE